MLGLYFSGTGNSRYALEVFLKKYCTDARIFAIEDEKAPGKVRENEEIIFSYSVQYSSIPKMLYDFITQNQTLWQGKKIFIIATMGMFSGDGAGILARLLRKYGAEITGGLHLRMPESRRMTVSESCAVWRGCSRSGCIFPIRRNTIPIS